MEGALVSSWYGLVCGSRLALTMRAWVRSPARLLSCALWLGLELSFWGAGSMRLGATCGA